MGIELWLDIEQGYCECLLFLMTSYDVGISDMTVNGRNVRFLAIDRNINATFSPRGAVVIADSTRKLALGVIGPKRVIALRCIGSLKVINNPLLCTNCFEFSGIYQTLGVGVSEVHVPDAFVCCRCGRKWEYENANPQA